MESKESVPKTLDWVKARTECSIERLFLLLIEVLRADVQSIQARSQGSTKYTLDVPTDSSAAVIKEEDMGGIRDRDGVVFRRTTSGIVARTAKNEVLFTAKPSLAINGDCRLEIDGQPLELWQVSRRALEPLFFP
jgi:hypothetical protein